MNTVWFGVGRTWRGLAFEKTLFGPVCRLGWLSFGLSPYDPPDFIKSWHVALHDALARRHPEQSTAKGQMK